MHIRSYLSPRFSYGWSAAPMFKTRIKDIANGRERRNADWDQPKHKITAPFQHLSDEAWQEIMRMIYACRGQAHSFLFQHPKDFQADEEVFGVGDSTKVRWQLSKLSVADTVAYQRYVTALYSPNPDGSSVQVLPVITVDGTPTTAFTPIYETGEVVFDAPPGTGDVLRWSGEYSLWVRFAQDWMPFSFDQPNGIYGSVDLIEDHPPKVA